MKDTRLHPRFIDYRTPTNPHGLRFVEGEAGDTGGGAAPAPAGAGETTTPPAAPVPTPPPSAPQAPTGQQTEQQQGEAPGKVEDLPDWAQKIITDARDGEAKARTGAKQQAADEARQALAQEVGKALGLVKDEAEQVDPAKITEQLTAAQAAQRDAALELALYKTASTAGLDPAKLLDSRSFMTSVKDVDPADADAVKAALDKVKDNTAFKTARAAGASTVEHPGGTGERPNRNRHVSLEEGAAAYYGT